MDRKNIKVRLTSEKDIREAYAALVTLGYLAQNDADFYVEQKAAWFYGEKNSYPSFQAGDYCIEWDNDLSYGVVQPHEEVTVAQLQEMAGTVGTVGTVDDVEQEAQNGTIEISWVEYKDLQRAARELRALEAQGVDNWEGYSYAMREANQDDDEDE